MYQSYQKLLRLMMYIIAGVSLHGTPEKVVYGAVKVTLSYNRDKLGLIFLLMLKPGHVMVNLNSQLDWIKK